MAGAGPTVGMGQSLENRRAPTGPTRGPLPIDKFSVSSQPLLKKHRKIQEGMVGGPRLGAKPTIGKPDDSEMARDKDNVGVLLAKRGPLSFNTTTLRFCGAMASSIRRASHCISIFDSNLPTDSIQFGRGSADRVTWDKSSYLNWSHIDEPYAAKQGRPHWWPLTLG